jgi:hypothetical protein
MFLFLLVLLRCGVAEPWGNGARPTPGPASPARSLLRVDPDQGQGGAQLAVGNACYSRVRWLNVRSQPYLTAPCHAQFSPQQLLTVLDLPNSQWAHVIYIDEDVGISGYVSQQYLIRQPPKRIGGNP